MTKVAILGGSGYTAVELIKILLRHPAVQIEAVISRAEGTPLVAEQHPSLAGRINLRCEPLNVDSLVARGVECVFGCRVDSVLISPARLICLSPSSPPSGAAARLGAVMRHPAQG